MIGSSVPRTMIVAVCAALLFCAAVPCRAFGPDTVEMTLGEKAPSFKLPGPDGKEYTLESFSGKTLVLTFWDCYADVCFSSTRIFEDIIKKYPADKIVVATVCYNIPKSMAAENYGSLLKTCSFGQTVLVDVEKKVGHAYAVKVPPTTFIIDRDSILRERVQGIPGLRTDEFNALLEKLTSQ